MIWPFKNSDWICRWFDNLPILVRELNLHDTRLVSTDWRGTRIYTTAINTCLFGSFILNTTSIFFKKKGDGRKCTQNSIISLLKEHFNFLFNKIGSLISRFTAQYNSLCDGNVEIAFLQTHSMCMHKIQLILKCPLGVIV